MHCDLRVRWKVASDLRFRAAISEPKTRSSCGISGDLAPSTRKSLAIAIVRFWCAKKSSVGNVYCIVGRAFLGDPYDWTTGAPHDGNEWKKCREVSRAHP